MLVVPTMIREYLSDSCHHSLICKEIKQQLYGYASFLALTEGGGSEEKTKISNRNLKSYAD